MRPDRPSSWTMALVVAGILIAGLVAGLAVDTLLSTRPIGLLLFPLAAVQIAALVVYRAYVVGLRKIIHESDQAEQSQDA